MKAGLVRNRDEKWAAAAGTVTVTAAAAAQKDLLRPRERRATGFPCLSARRSVETSGEALPLPLCRPLSPHSSVCVTHGSTSTPTLVDRHRLQFKTNPRSNPCPHLPVPSRSRSLSPFHSLFPLLSDRWEATNHVTATCPSALPFLCVLSLSLSLSQHIWWLNAATQLHSVQQSHWHPHCMDGNTRHCTLAKVANNSPVRGGSEGWCVTCKK